MKIYENDHRTIRVSHDEIKKKLKIKGSFANLEIKYINGHLIKFDKTNLSVTEPHKIIASNSSSIIIAYLYNNNDKIYLVNYFIKSLYFLTK